MKKFLLFFLLTLPVLAYGQMDNKAPFYRIWGPTLINTNGFAATTDTAFFALIIKGNKAVMLGSGDTADITPKPAAVLYNNADSTFYYGNGVAWKRLGSDTSNVSRKELNDSLHNYVTLNTLDTITANKRFDGRIDVYKRLGLLGTNAGEPVIYFSNLSGHLEQNPTDNVIGFNLKRFYFSGAGDKSASFDAKNLTDDQVYTLPDKSGTVALATDIPSTPTLQQVATAGDSTTTSLITSNGSPTKVTLGTASTYGMIIDAGSFGANWQRGILSEANNFDGTKKIGSFIGVTGMGSSNTLNYGVWSIDSSDVTNVVSSLKSLRLYPDGSLYYGTPPINSSTATKFLSLSSDGHTISTRTASQVRSDIGATLQNVTTLGDSTSVSSITVNSGSGQQPVTIGSASGMAGVLINLNHRPGGWVKEFEISQPSPDLTLNRGVTYGGYGSDSLINYGFWIATNDSLKNSYSATNGIRLYPDGSLWYAIPPIDSLSATKFFVLGHDNHTISTRTASQVLSDIGAVDTAVNGLHVSNDSILLGGTLSQDTHLYGDHTVFFNNANVSVGTNLTSTSYKMLVDVDTTGSLPNEALATFLSSKDPDLSKTSGFNGLYGSTSPTFSSTPSADVQYTYLAGILGKFNIPQSSDSFVVNTAANPAAAITAALQSQDGNIRLSDFAWFNAGSNQVDPLKPDFTGHIDTAYGFYMSNPFSGAMHAGLRRVYDVYLAGGTTYNFLAGHAGFGTNTPTAAVDIAGTSSDTGADLFRVEKSYTPTSSSDAAGQTGSIAWDDSYIYVKTSTGWKRAALTTF